LRTLVLDTGGLYALLDRKDPNHENAAKAIADVDDLVVPPLVLVELDYWLRKLGGGARAFASFVDDVLAGAYRLEQLVEADLARAAALGVTYSDLDLGLVDASVIALCERLDHDDVLTFDRRHFSVVRPLHCPALRLLPN
jgi:predicted nucleic acid-binding protein